MAADSKDITLVVSLVLLFGVTWYFQSSLDLLQQQVEYDKELLFKLQEQINVSMIVLSPNISHWHLRSEDLGSDCEYFMV